MFKIGAQEAWNNYVDVHSAIVRSKLLSLRL